MKKIILSVLITLLAGTFASANSIESVIKKSDISKNATVSVSVRKLNNGNVVYENDSHKLMNPASTLKAFTTPVIYKQLGNNYSFKTQMYKSGNNAYLKLSADPLFNSKMLKNLINSLKNTDLKKPDKIYIDDTVTDDIEYGIGWMWDDEVSLYMPKYSRYNLDGNVFTLTIEPSEDKKTINVKPPYEYNVSVINRLKYSTKNNITVTRKFWDGIEKVVLSGTVNFKTDIKIPAYNQKRYFISALQDVMNYSGVTYYGSFDSKKTPANAQLIKEEMTPITKLYPMIMENSNNMVTETLFKIAGGKYLNTTGTTYGGVQAFKDYYKALGADTDGIIVVDGSGVSRNDLLSTDWMTNALYKINTNDKNFNYKEKFNIPNRGTLTNRLFELRDYLWAKTGTLANISGITGYITTKNGNDYTFAILIQNTNKPETEVKKLEDEIITTIYNKY